jgi:ribosomal-protein-alanine N-acetyltransferase
MSALWRGDATPADAGGATAPVLRPMTLAQLDAVLAIEVAAYAFPWTRGNFVDSLAAGHLAQVLHSEGGEMLGYFVAMAGVDEMHLLNITVAPQAQGRGHARALIDALVALCRTYAAHSLWLEVRAGNARARSMYEHFGFAPAGLRKAYYPAPFGRREDAVVMRLTLGAAPAEADDALD